MTYRLTDRDEEDELMKYYKVIARNYDDIIIQESDPHTWEECQEIYHEYFSYDEVGSVNIIYMGKL